MSGRNPEEGSGHYKKKAVRGRYITSHDNPASWQNWPHGLKTTSRRRVCSKKARCWSVELYQPNISWLLRPEWEWDMVQYAIINKRIWRYLQSESHQIMSCRMEPEIPKWAKSCPVRDPSSFASCPSCWMFLSTIQSLWLIAFINYLQYISVPLP